MKDWSKEFNALPESVRMIGCAMEARTRIQQLGFEKDRLIKACTKSVWEIEGLIKINEAWLAKLETTAPPQPIEREKI